MEEKCCNCYMHENKIRSDEEKKALINRLLRIEGQIRGIRAMVEKDAYCPDVMTQTSAAVAALNSFNRELLSSHVKSCVVNDIKDGREDAAVEELLSTLQKLMK